MYIDSWKPVVTWSSGGDYAPYLKYQLTLSCPVCRTAQMFIIHRELYDYGFWQRNFPRPGAFGQPTECGHCGSTSNVPQQAQIDFLEASREQPSAYWIMRQIIGLTDFRTSVFYRSRAEAKRAKRGQRHDREVEAAHLAARTPEEIEADHRYQKYHYWCDTLFGDLMERDSYRAWSGFAYAITCQRCRKTLQLSDTLYHLGDDYRQANGDTGCYDCYFELYACDCQKKENRR
jgi:hypothetical protein